LLVTPLPWGLGFASSSHLSWILLWSASTPTTAPPLVTSATATTGTCAHLVVRFCTLRLHMILFDQQHRP
jgi:hypothetical protein